ncbi:hypothetical protein ABW19_dt0203666 [Dactylella cylindrospora]|nr:hypothetical protein ABW19_dt0203666 [Dactylella cylindrospora]
MSTPYPQRKKKYVDYREWGKEPAKTDSSVQIDLLNCEPLDSEVLGSDTGLGHLPDGTEVRFQILRAGHLSLVTLRFFSMYIHGKTFPWLNGQKIFFPDVTKCKPGCYIQINERTNIGLIHGIEIRFRKSHGGSCKVRVYGLAEVPLFIGGIPLRIPVMIVQHLPIHKTESELRTEMPSMLLLSGIFNGITVPLRFENNIMHHQVHRRATIHTAVLPQTEDIALEVYAELIYPDPHKRGKDYEYGYGIYFAHDSVYNISGSILSPSIRSTPLLEVRAAKQVVITIRNMCTHSFTGLDFTDVVIFCSSPYVVNWAPEFKEHGHKKGWLKSLRIDNPTKDVWIEMMEAQRVARKTFHWVYLEREYNEEAVYLARSGCMGLRTQNWQVLLNEARNVSAMKDLLRPDMRPGKKFEGICLDGGFCRRPHPRGFAIKTICQCGEEKDGWEQKVHY